MFKHKIQTSIDIDAPPARVWEVLLDFPKYGEWNPFIKAIKGEAKVGEVVNLEFFNGFKINPRLLTVDPETEFRWKGKLACGGLFDGEHFFKLSPLEGGAKTRFDHGEDMAGAFIPLLGSLLRETEVNFKKMNDGIKARSEGT